MSVIAKKWLVLLQFIKSPSSDEETLIMNVTQVESKLGNITSPLNAPLTLL